MSEDSTTGHSTVTPTSEQRKAENMVRRLRRAARRVGQSIFAHRACCPAAGNTGLGLFPRSPPQSRHHPRGIIRTDDAVLCLYGSVCTCTEKKYSGFYYPE